jgi:outer membrane protein assembly factor BamB
MQKNINLKLFKLTCPFLCRCCFSFKLSLIIVLILSYILHPLCLLNADDWPSWRGPNGNGISTEKSWNPKALEGGAKILWRKKLAAGYSAVSVKGDDLYTMGNKNKKDIVYCLKVSTREEVWRYSYDCPNRSYSGTFSTPVIDEGNIYTFSRNGDVFCLNATTGKKQWYVDITEAHGATIPKYGFSGSPVIHEDKVILNASKHGIALDKNTGEKVWASATGKCGYATPVIYNYNGKLCTTIFAYRRLNGVELKTGKLLWHFPWIFDDGADSPDPVVVGSRVFISTAYRNGASVIDFSDNEPKQLWFKKDIQDEFGSAIYLNGYLYVPHGDTRHRTAYLKCIEFNTGREVWSRDTEHCSLIYVDGKFIVLNQWGELGIMEASEKGYEDLSKAKVVETSSKVRCWTAPVLANGKIYIRTNTGILICVDVSKQR